MTTMARLWEAFKALDVWKEPEDPRYQYLRDAALDNIQISRDEAVDR